jgi:hypothetical protein
MLIIKITIKTLQYTQVCFDYPQFKISVLHFLSKNVQIYNFVCYLYESNGGDEEYI